MITWEEIVPGILRSFDEVALEINGILGDSVCSRELKVVRIWKNGFGNAADTFVNFA